MLVLWKNEAYYELPVFESSRVTLTWIMFYRTGLLNWDRKGNSCHEDEIHVMKKMDFQRFLNEVPHQDHFDSLFIFAGHPHAAIIYQVTND